MKTRYVILFLIILFAGFVRVFKISTLPPALYYDELDAGYQAMVFSQNLTDYYGNKFPVHFRSFGDYRTSLHIYSIALFQQLTHNPELSIRLPSAIFSVLTILLFYFLTKSLIVSSLLAISPWAIHYSRIGFEVSGMLFCLLLGIYFWQKFISNSKFFYLALSVFFLCLTPYFYSTTKLFLPIIGILLLTIWFRTILNLGPKKILLAIFITLLLLSPLVIDTLKGKSGFRFSYISIFTLPHREQVVDTLRYQDSQIDHPKEIGISTTFISSLFHNKLELIGERFITNYVSSFSTEFLLLKGDTNLRHSFGGHGLLYLIDFVFLIVGLFSFKKNKISTFFFWLLILSPIPYALTRDTDTPHATRLILMLPSLIYFTYLGISKYAKFKYLIIFIYAMSFLNFWHYYNYHYPNLSARAWNTGMKEVILATNSYPNQNLVFSDADISFVSFFLFYHPYMLNKDDSIDNHLKQFANNSFSGQVLDDQYYFGRINFSNLSNLPKNSLFIVPKSEYTSINASKFQIIKFIEKTYTEQEEFYLLKLND